MINPISFKAKFVNKATVQKLHSDGCYHNYSVSFVELNPFSASDRVAISLLSKEWGSNQKKNYSSQISKTMDMIFCRHNKEKSPKFYAITTQKNNFMNLKYEKILGIAQVVNNRTNINLEYLQAHPDYMAKINQVTNKIGKIREYKHLGKALLDSLINRYPKKNITLSSDAFATEFYLKCGLKKIPWEWNGFILKAK